MKTKYAYLIMLYDDREPSGVFATEEKARAAAERFLIMRWNQEESYIRNADYFSEKEKEEHLTELQGEKDCWKEEGFIDDLIYIQLVPMGKLINYNGEEY